MSTAVFMAGGFVGFASGGMIATALVHKAGLPGLYPLIALSIIGVVMVAAFKIQLAVEPKPANPDKKSDAALDLIVQNADVVIAAQGD